MLFYANLPPILGKKSLTTQRKLSIFSVCANTRTLSSAFLEKVNRSIYQPKIHKLTVIGLNVEQRKKLTIAIELSARLGLLLFLDEPTSGLDSQTAAMTVDVLRELSQSGQAIVCTIHQPSTFLFEQFNHLLLLTSDGKPAYFGGIGENGEKVVDYFVEHGAQRPPKDVNPAEWLFEVLEGSHVAVESDTAVNWSQVWKASNEFVGFRRRLDQIETESRQQATTNSHSALEIAEQNREFATPFRTQLWECFKRVNQQYWRSPIYIYSKIFSCLGSVCLLP